MAYCLHIECDNGPISIEAWKTTLNMTEGVRVAGKEVAVKNPVTGEAIAVRGNEGDIEISPPSGLGAYISFRRGRASFHMRDEFENSENPVRIVIAKLAKSLNAKIVGDEGEEYEW